MRSIESQDGCYCVDIFVRPDGSFGFEEFRRDVEDNDRWTKISYYSSHSYKTREDAEEKMIKAIAWIEPDLF